MPPGRSFVCKSYKPTDCVRALTAWCPAGEYAARRPVTFFPQASTHGLLIQNAILMHADFFGYIFYVTMALRCKMQPFTAKARPASCLGTMLPRAITRPCAAAAQSSQSLTDYRVVTFSAKKYVLDFMKHRITGVFPHSKFVDVSVMRKRKRGSESV